MSTGSSGPSSRPGGAGGPGDDTRQPGTAALHGALRRLARRRLSPHTARRRDLSLPARGEPSFGKAPPPVRGGAHGLPRRAGGWPREHRTRANHDDRPGHAARAGAARHRESRRRGDGGRLHRRTAMTTERVSEILSWYGSDNPGTLTNLARLLTHGALAGTGRLVILPVDQGFEHGPGRSFAMNPPAYDPRYHFELAIEAGCNAYAAPLGFLEAGAREFARPVPLILKLSNPDVLLAERDPAQAPPGRGGD